MSIQEHVTSLPVSKRLAPHLPVGWESEFYWERTKIGKKTKWCRWRISNKPFVYNGGDLYGECFPALLLSELLDLLPQIIIPDFRNYKEYEWSQFSWGICYLSRLRNETLSASIFGDDNKKVSRIQSVAELFMWVKENGHIKEGA